jgi:outer membrane protein assembly factor BamB
MGQSVTRRNALIGLGALAVAGCGTAQAVALPSLSARPPGTLLWKTAAQYGVGGLATVDDLVCGFSDGVYAYHPATGHLAWHVDSGNVAQAVVSGGQVTVANMLHSGFHSLNGATGRTAWTFDSLNVGSQPWLGLAYADGRVYGVGPAGDAVIVVALNNRSGRLEWRTTLPASVLTITAGGGRVYLSGVGLIALDGATGRKLWTASASGLSVPAGVTDGVVYGSASGSKVAVADAATGSPLWSHPAIWGFAANDSTMFVSNSAVIDFETNSGYVLALDIRNGRMLWQRNFPQRVPTIFAATGSVLYGAEELGTVYALSASTGQELWRHRLPVPDDRADELVFLVAAGTSVIAANVDQLYALQA